MLTVKHTFKLFDVINKHFNNEQDSRIFVSEIEEIMDNKVDLKMNDFATRKDLAELKTELKIEITSVKSELKSEIADVKSELKSEIAEVKTELKSDIAELRTELTSKIAEVKTELKSDIAEVRTELTSKMADFRDEVNQKINTLSSDFRQLDAGINLNISNSALILERSQKEQLKWLIGAMVAIISLAVAVIKLF